MNWASTAVSRSASDTMRMWNSTEMVGDRSMKSTRSSASQWNDLRNKSKVKRATNLGEKSSLKGVKMKRYAFKVYHE